MIYLETDRLILRNVAPKDLDIMYDYRNNEICARYQRGQSKGYDEIAALIDRRKDDVLYQGDDHFMAIALKDSDDMVGEVVTFYKGKTITLGYTMSYRHHRKGFAFEMLSALIDALHARFPEWEVVCCVDPRNEASMGLLKKLEFEDLGYVEPITSQILAKWPVED